VKADAIGIYTLADYSVGLKDRQQRPLELPILLCDTPSVTVVAIVPEQ
jgi:hypothetical protein